MPDPGFAALREPTQLQSQHLLAHITINPFYIETDSRNNSRKISDLRETGSSYSASNQQTNKVSQLEQQSSQEATQ
jgi:hypothetical protein